ncbi:PhzF family phenazine biosynthesis protein [Methylothermus subterraneus]
MTAVIYYLADAFTREPFNGAQVGVFPKAESLSERQMQQLAGELNLPHSVFLLPPENPQASYLARLFTPYREVEFAAQAFIAAGFVLAQSGTVAESAGATRILLETRRGLLPMHFLCDSTGLKQVALALTVEPIVDSFTPPIEELAAMLGLKSTLIETKRFTPKIASCGRPFLIVPLVRAEAVEQVVFDFKRWSESTAPATAAQEILLFSPRTREPQADFRARLVGPNIGPKEDPPVGEAMPAFCGYLCSFPQLRQGTYAFTVERGSKSSRRSLLNLEMDHKGQDKLSLRIGGKAVVIAAGTIRIP